MACFLVPAAEALALKAAETVAAKSGPAECSGKKEGKIPVSIKLGWLTKMLCGGSVLLAFEHIWHGEIVPYFPFLTAASDPVERAEMLREMSTSGVAMALLVTVFWAVICAASEMILKRKGDISEGSAV